MVSGFVFFNSGLLSDNLLVVYLFSSICSVVNFSVLVLKIIVLEKIWLSPRSSVRFIILIALILVNIRFKFEQIKLVKSTLFKDVQFINIFLIVGIVILKFVKLTNSKFLQFKNISFMLLTYVVLKLDKSKDSKE